MRLNLRDLPDGITAIEVDQPDGSPDLPGFSDIRGRLEVDRNGDVLKVTGTLEYACQQECSRCLKPFREVSREPIEIYFRPPLPGDQGEGRERELKADDLTVVAYRGPELDIWTSVRECLELAVPLKPVCRPECRGICNGCGRDLNREACRCRDRGIDPRWEPLAALGKKKATPPRKSRKKPGDRG